MTKYLITGGCGFIGSHLANCLIEQGFQVRVLDNLATGLKENLPQEAELLVGSVTQPEMCQKALDGVDGVFHLAAIPSVMTSIEQWHALHQVNSGGTLVLFEALKNLKKTLPVIYASSAAVYGETSQAPVHEEAPLAPLSPYAVDKMTSEFQGKIAWKLFGIPNIGFRFFNVYGPRQNPKSSYAGVISIFSERISTQKPIMIYGNGEQKRDFIYVGDIVHMMTQTMKTSFQGAEIYNLCTGQATSILELVEYLERITGKKAQLTHLPARPGEIQFSLGNPQKAYQKLGLKATTSIQQGLFKLQT